MTTSHEGFVHIRVEHGLLIRESECQVMASTDLKCSVGPTDVQSCWLFVCWALHLDGCAPVLWYLNEPTSLLWSGLYPGEASAASAKTRSMAKSNTVRD